MTRAPSDALRWPLPTRRATLHLAEKLARGLGAGDLLILAGELGAGKTFLARGLCRALGVGREQRVTSPSFTLVNELVAHPRGKPPLLIIHADLYRVESAAEVIDLGLRERREDSLLIVEWGAPYEHELGGGAAILEITLDQGGRMATLSGPSNLLTLIADRS